MQVKESSQILFEDSLILFFMIHSKLPRLHSCPGFSFKEVNSVRASTSKVVCCHFSSDGKLLATGGHDKKVSALTSKPKEVEKKTEEKMMLNYLSVGFKLQAVLWYTDSLKSKSNLEEHSSLITDVRFSPSMPRLATSSFDKTVRVWDADNVSAHSLYLEYLVSFITIQIFSFCF